MAKPTGLKVMLTILKIAWVPLLIVFAFFVGAYLGYEFMTDSSGSEVFSIETWKSFVQQIKSLR